MSVCVKVERVRGERFRYVTTRMSDLVRIRLNTYRYSSRSKCRYSSGYISWHYSSEKGRQKVYTMLVSRFEDGTTWFDTKMNRTYGGGPGVGS